MRQPVEAKVKAGALAGAVAGLIVWALTVYVFRGDMPQAVAAAVPVLVVWLGQVIAGYLAPHTPRRGAGVAVPVVPGRLRRGERAL